MGFQKRIGGDHRPRDFGTPPEPAHPGPKPPRAPRPSPLHGTGARLASGELRSVTLSIVVTPTESALIRKAAALRERSLSDFCRRVILNGAQHIVEKAVSTATGATNA